MQGIYTSRVGPALFDLKLAGKCASGRANSIYAKLALARKAKIFWERHGGIDRRLTDLHGHVIKPLITGSERRPTARLPRPWPALIGGRMHEERQWPQQAVGGSAR